MTEQNLDGNRRRAALQLLTLETGLFTEVPVNILPEMEDDRIAVYLDIIHGISSQRSWPTIAKWQVPYRYYSELKYSVPDIAKMLGYSQETLSVMLKAMDAFTEYEQWLKQTGLVDQRLSKRLSLFRGLTHDAHILFKANKDELFQLTYDGKLDGINFGNYRFLGDILSNPALKQLLLDEGAPIAMASLLQIRGLESRRKKALAKA